MYSIIVDFCPPAVPAVIGMLWGRVAPPFFLTDCIFFFFLLSVELQDMSRDKIIR